MSTPHAAHIAANLIKMADAVEQLGTLPDGTRPHFVLLMWTDEGVAQHVQNTPLAGVFEMMVSMLDAFCEDKLVTGPGHLDQLQ